MKGVYHIHVLEVGRSRLVSYVDRVLERQVPDRESLKLGVSGFYTFLVLVIELRQACCQLAATAAGTCDYGQRLCNFYVRIGAVSLLADYGLHVCRVTLGVEMLIRPDTSPLQAVYELVDSRSVFVSGDYHAVYSQLVLAEYIYKPEHFQIVCYSEILTCLAVYYISRVDADDDLGLIFEPFKKFYLGVFVKAGKNSHSVFVMYQLAAEFQI